jgi:fumarylacetoacetate (FAA) hydrolase
MKLASLKTGGRDGTLLVVSSDLALAVTVPQIAPTLQNALDNWARCEAPLEDVFKHLNDGAIDDAFEFDETLAHSPLPRAYQWCEASVWITHLERCRKSTNRDLPQSLYTEIGMYQGGSDSFVPPRSPMICPDDDLDADFEAGVCVITDDVPMGTSSAQAGGHIKLIVLVNDFSLRRIQFPEMAKGLGVLQSKPANAYTPVAVSPQTLGEGWNGVMLAQTLTVSLRGEVIGTLHPESDAQFGFPQLIAHLARTRDIEAGSIIGAGTVSNRDPSRGHGCILERRAAEILETGKARTEFLKFNDRVRIESYNDNGLSIFGAIDQALAPLTSAAPTEAAGVFK